MLLAALVLALATVPKPEPLFTASRKGLGLTGDYPGRAQDAHALAAVRRAVAADLRAGKFAPAAREGAEPLAAAVLAAVRDGNARSGVDPHPWRWWATLVDTRTATFYSLGRLETAAAWADAMTDIALGLEE
jgi:hypothetical protein